MNKPQKKLTIALMILFTATLIFFPWTTEGRDFLPSPFCVAPMDLGIYPD